MHVAPYTSIYRSLQDVTAYERNIRPYVKIVGISTKDYHLPEVTKALLEVTKRDLVIQTVRDPIESFISRMNREFFLDSLHKLANQPFDRFSVDDTITDAVVRTITPTAAEAAYEVSTFKEHIIIDVEDLKGDRAEATVRSLWLRLCGDASPANTSHAAFKPIGSRAISQIRTFGSIFIKSENIKIHIFPVVDGDLWIGYFDPINNFYSGKEAILNTFPDIRELAPDLKLDGPVHMAAYAHNWYKIHPKIRPHLCAAAKVYFIKQMRRFNDMFVEAEKTMTFTLDSMTPLQREILKASLEDDFFSFRRRHPAVVERWAMARTFFGV